MKEKIKNRTKIGNLSVVAVNVDEFWKLLKVDEETINFGYMQWSGFEHVLKTFTLLTASYLGLN